MRDPSKNESSRRIEWALLGLILLATLAAYSPALSFQFTYDDFPQIVNNRLVQSWQYLHFYFKIHVWANSSNWGNYYRPLFLLALLLEHTVFGLHPMGWHAVSIACHLGVVVLVYALAKELLESQAALVSTMIFALHPVHIESVAWVSGITDPQLALFAIPCMLCYIRFRRQGACRYLWMSLAFFAGALLAKETAVIVPVVLGVYEFFGTPKEQRPPGKLFAERILPFLLFAVLLAGYAIVRRRVLGAFSKQVIALDPVTIMLSWPGVLLKYARLLLAPYPLSLFYDVPYVTHPEWKHFWLPLATLLPLAAAMAWLFRRGSGVVRLALTLLVLPILPLLNLSLLPLSETVHDRYLYLPSIGLALLAGAGWQWLAAHKFGHGTDVSSDASSHSDEASWPGAALITSAARIRRTALLAVVSIGLAFAALTAVQTLPWADNLVLYTHSAEQAPNLPVVHNNLGNELSDRRMYDDAIRQYQIALKILPNYWFSTFNLGYVYYQKGMYPEANEWMRRALRINAQDADTWYYEGLIQQKLGNRDEARRDLGIAVQLMPGSKRYREALAEVEAESAHGEQSPRSNRAPEENTPR